LQLEAKIDTSGLMQIGFGTFATVQHLVLPFVSLVQSALVAQRRVVCVAVQLSWSWSEQAAWHAVVTLPTVQLGKLPPVSVAVPQHMGVAPLQSDGAAHARLSSDVAPSVVAPSVVAPASSAVGGAGNVPESFELLAAVPVSWPVSASPESTGAQLASRVLRSVPESTAAVGGGFVAPTLLLEPEEPGGANGKCGSVASPAGSLELQPLATRMPAEAIVARRPRLPLPMLRMVSPRAGCREPGTHSNPKATR
jgi:hypothetical protein